MGLFSSLEGPGSSSTSRRTSRYATPNFAPPGGGQFSERGFPERVDVSDTLLQGAELAVRGPAYIYGRLPAVAGELLGRDANGKTVFDNISEGVRDIPVLGPHLDNAGKLTSAAFDESMKFTRSLNNAPYARLMEKYAGASDDQQVDPLDLMSLPPGILDIGIGLVPGAAAQLAFPPGTTWGDLKKKLRERGFSDSDIQAVASGEKGWLDFGGLNERGESYSTSNKEGVAGTVEDLGNQVILDPLNLVFGAGIISKGVRGTKTLLRLKNSGQVAAGAVTTHKPLSLSQGVAAIANGTWEGVTSASLSAFVHGWVRGSGPVFRSYRNASLGTTGFQVGANIIDEIVPEEWSSQVPGMEEILGFWRRVGEHKPLSDNQLFQLAAIMKFPARDLMAQSYNKARSGKVAVSRVDHRLKIFKLLGGEDKVRGLLRDSESVDAMFAQILKVAIARKAWKQGVGPNKALEMFWGTSLPELGHHFSGLNKRLARLMKEFLDEGNISGEEMVEAAKVMFAGRGDVLRDVTGGLVRQTFDPDQFLTTWNEWEPLARHLDDVFQGTNVLVPGISDEVVTTSQIDWMLAMLDDAALAGKTSGDDFADILMHAPAVFNLDQGGMFARTLTRSAKMVDDDIEKMKRRLREIREEHAFDSSDWLADAREWDATAARARDRTAARNRKFNQDGTLSDDVNPDYGDTQLVVPTQSFVKQTRAGALADPTATQVQALRARPGVVEAEFNIPLSLAEGGYGVRSSIRTLAIDKRITKTGLVMKVDDATDFQALSEMAALAAQETGQGSATIVLRGEQALQKHGVKANAAEFRWEPGRMDAETLDRTVKHLRNQFGDRVMVNDSTGTIRVLVRDTDTKYVRDLDKRLRTIEDIVGSAPAKQRAFVQDIVAKAKKTDDPGTRTFKSVEEIASSRHSWHFARERLQKRRGELRPDEGVAGSGGVSGDGQLGPAQREVIGRGLGPDDAPRERRATRWESDNGRGGPDRGGVDPDQHRVDAGGIGEYRGRVRDATTGNARSGRVTVPADAELFITADGHAGVFVTNTGRLHLWRKPHTQPGDDWDSVLAAASDSATWTAVPDIRARRGHPGIDQLAQHGWRPVARTPDDLVYLVRDPNGWTGSLEIPPRAANQGGWTSIKQQVPVWSDGQAKSTVRAMRQMYLGETRPRLPKEGPLAGPTQAAKTEFTVPQEGWVPGAYEGALESEFFAQQNYGGNIPPGQPKIHVGATRDGAAETLRRVDIVAQEMGVTYKWVKQLDELQGEFGAGGRQAGKFITLYPDGSQGRPLAERLHAELRGHDPGAPRAPSEVAFADDAPITHRSDVEDARFAGGGGYGPGRPDIIGTSASRRPPRAPVGDDVVETNPPEVTPDPSRNKAAARKWERLVELDNEIRNLEATLKHPSRSKRLSAAKTEQMEIQAGVRDAEFGIAGTAPVNHPGRAYTTLNDAQAIDDVDALTFLWDTDEELAKFKPNFDPSVSENLDPAELEKIFALEAEIRRTNPQYTIKLAPQTATPYTRGQGSAYRAAIAGRRMASDDWRFKVTSKLAQAQSLLFDPVYSRVMAQDTRQEMYNQWLNAGASREEVDRFMRALQLEWDSNKFLSPRLGVHQYRSAAAMGESNIVDIATGKKPVGEFKGFDKSVLENLAKRGVKPHDIVRASSSRIYRNLAKRYPAVDGQGNLGNIADQLYGLKGVTLPGAGGALSVARGGSHLIKTGYHIFRFLLDPRWYAMNLFEADILGFAKFGAKASRPGGARRIDKVTKKFTSESRAAQVHQNRFGSDFVAVEDILATDATASGWLDPRKLGGYTGAAFDVQRPQTTRDVIMKMIDSGDPIITDLRAKFGIDPEEWVKGLDDLLYNLDTKGARATVLDEAAELANKKELIWNEVPKNAGDELFNEFLDRLYQQHQKNFKDIMHTFHGNVNRSNFERLLNSPLLWWPISYQLKAGKWLIDILTDRMLGAKTDLMGVWGLDKLMSNHAWQYENDQEYAKIWDDHPALWRTASMFLPVTPFDMGVFMARWTRYSNNWIGAQLGLWDQDPSYPQDPGNFFLRSTNLGAVFSADILSDIFDEAQRATR